MLTAPIISFEEGFALLEQGGILLDVRTSEEYEYEHAAGARLLPLAEITQRTAKRILPDPATPVVVYCRTGNRSAQAARRLLELGYPSVYDLGGLNGWPYGMDFGLEE